MKPEYIRKFERLKDKNPDLYNKIINGHPDVFRPKDHALNVFIYDIEDNRVRNALIKMAIRKELTDKEPPFDNVRLHSFKDIEINEFLNLHGVGEKIANDIEEEFRKYRW